MPEASIVKTQALCLQIRPWSKTSHIVTWLTPEYGLVVTSVKGACRPKSAFLGQYDLFYTCELLFYRNGRGGIHAIRECVPQERRDPLRSDWRAAATAAYLAELTARAVPTGEAAGVYALLGHAFDRLAAGKADDFVGMILWYEIHLLHFAGLRPDMTLCPVCAESGTVWHNFVLADGRFACPHTGAKHAGNGATVRLHADVRRLFVRMSNATDPLPVKKSENFEISRLGLLRFLGIFVSLHLDVPAVVRRVALETLSFKEKK